MSRMRSLLRANALAYFGYGLMGRMLFSGALLVAIIRYRLTRQTTTLPLPPPRLRYWVHGALDTHSFLSSGNAAYVNYKAILARYPFTARRPLRLLDIGCGCARVLRHFFANGEKFDFHGVDINRDAIEWVSTNLAGFAQWSVNSPLPPTEYPSSHFDVILCNSVFTHLNEEFQFLWLAEVQRLLHNDGIAVVSVHGDSVWQTTTAIPELQDSMQTHGFHFHHNHTGVRNYLGFPDFYQTAFHSKTYIHKRWSDYFKIVAYIEKGIGNHQDIVVLRQLAG